MEKVNKNKWLLGAALVLFGAGYLLGNRAVPRSVTEQTTDTRKNVTTVTKRVKAPDGTVTTVVEKVDKSVRKDTKKDLVVPAPEQKVIVSGTARAGLGNLQPVYGVLVQKPLFSRLILGAGVDTVGQAQVTVGWSF